MPQLEVRSTSQPFFSKAAASFVGAAGAGEGVVGDAMMLVGHAFSISLASAGPSSRAWSVSPTRALGPDAAQAEAIDGV